MYSFVFGDSLRISWVLGFWRHCVKCNYIRFTKWRSFVCHCQAFLHSDNHGLFRSYRPTNLLHYRKDWSIQNHDDTKIRRRNLAIKKEERRDRINKWDRQRWQLRWSPSANRAIGPRGWASRLFLIQRINWHLILYGQPVYEISFDQDFCSYNLPNNLIRSS